MKLIEQQKLLAELYTNPDTRKDYFQNQQLLDKKEVVVFAEGLLHKRHNVVKTMMPFSFSVKSKLSDLFFDYASSNSMQGYHLKHQRDAFSFLTYLKSIKEINQDHYLTQILKYEKFVVKCGMPGRFLFFFSSYRLPLATEETIHHPEVLKGNIVIVYYKFFLTRPWKRMVIKY